LAQGGIVQNHQEAEADKTSFHGSFRSTGITRESLLGSDQSCARHLKRFQHRRAHYRLDKNAIDPQLLDLSFWRGQQPASVTT
jgi:hypothetical protein